MKKVGTCFLVFILSVVIFLFGFNYNSNVEPGSYYNVYLDSEYIGMIKSKEELDDYINSQAIIIRDNVRKYMLIVDSIDTFNKIESTVQYDSSSKKSKVDYLIKNSKQFNISDDDLDNLKYYKENKVYNYSESDINDMKEYIESNEIYTHVDNVYTPNGIEVKKVFTYNGNVTSVPEIYKRIMAKKSCTVAGYKFTIKNEENKEDIVIYTIDDEIFSDAINRLITIFVDSNKYDLYKNGTQPDITTVGSLIENIYVGEDITYKATNIPVEEKIYTDSTSLSAYLLYGDGFTEKKVTAKKRATIDSIPFDNRISEQEFLIFNNKYTSRDNLIAPGTEVTISKIAPKIQIVVETYEVSDKETDYDTQERFDESLPQGTVIVTQEGEKGIERVTQDVKSINGEISYINPVSKETIKASTPRIVTIGTKFIPNVGSTASWGWPTNSGYTITSYYGYRVSGYDSANGNIHAGIDIAGTGYGSPVYAANNGVIVTRQYKYDYGNHILINHNNGYYTLYAHMSSFAPNLSVGSTVSRGQIIGYVGSTGWASGPHLHFEIRTCEKWACTTNPLNYYR